MRKSVVSWLGCGISVSLALVSLTGCGDDSGSNDGSAGTGAAGTGGGTADYAAVSALLGGPEQPGIGKCAAVSCHGGDSAGKASLNFKTATDLVSVLVNVDSCENKAMKRVKPGDPDNSWLWIKLNADIIDTNGGQIVFPGTPDGCSGVANGFGTRMPQAFGTFDKLPAKDLALVHDWIAAGAPGPND